VFDTLPRHPAYDHELVDGAAYLTPREACVHARLALDGESPRLSDSLAGRRLTKPEHDALLETFALALRRVPPFETLDDDSATRALRDCLEATLRGDDGPLLEAACFVAEGDRPRVRLSGGLRVTLLPDANPETRAAWVGCKESPPTDWVERRRGRPHFPWVFVEPGAVRQGLARALLAASVGTLRRIGYSELGRPY
jgi:GNAT superfamily N-acetyltransferase